MESQPIEITHLLFRSGSEWWRDPITLFTFVLMVATVGLFGSTLLLWRSANRTANLAEDPLFSLESPFIVAQVEGGGLRFSLGGTLSRGGAFKYRLLNYGRTPATIIEIHERIVVAREGAAMPEAIDPITGPGEEFPPGTVVAADRPFEGESHQGRIDGLETIRVTQEMAKERVTTQLFFLGFVRYSDIFNNSHIYGVCFQLIGGRGFVEAGGKNYNYKEPDPLRGAKR